MRKLTRFKPTPFLAKDSSYNKNAANAAVAFICLFAFFMRRPAHA